jgi:3,4-dihydroxy 2-butanone 4-phosphate synthase/GTP cyclohydrolase II
MSNFSSIPQAIQELQKGNMLIVLDSESRENQGDLIFAAETATTERINFLLQKCRGMICVPVTQAKAKQIDLALMVPQAKNTEKTRVNFTVTVDVKTVTSYGISASDRAATIKAIAKDDSKANDFVKPGHLFPLLARSGGILERDGHTEATIELLKLAKLNPTGVLCEILNEKGQVASLSELKKFSREFNIKIISIPDLIKYVKK